MTSPINRVAIEDHRLIIREVVQNQQGEKFDLSIGFTSGSRGTGIRGIDPDLATLDYISHRIQLIEGIARDALRGLQTVNPGAQDLTKIGFLVGPGEETAALVSQAAEPIVNRFKACFGNYEGFQGEKQGDTTAMSLDGRTTVNNLLIELRDLFTKPSVDILRGGSSPAASRSSSVLAEPGSPHSPPDTANSRSAHQTPVPSPSASPSAGGNSSAFRPIRTPAEAPHSSPRLSSLEDEDQHEALFKTLDDLQDEPSSNGSNTPRSPQSERPRRSSPALTDVASHEQEELESLSGSFEAESTASDKREEAASHSRSLGAGRSRSASASDISSQRSASAQSSRPASLATQPENEPTVEQIFILAYNPAFLAWKEKHRKTHPNIVAPFDGITFEQLCPLTIDKAPVKKKGITEVLKTARDDDASVEHTLVSELVDDLCKAEREIRPSFTLEVLKSSFNSNYYNKIIKHWVAS